MSMVNRINQLLNEPGSAVAFYHKGRAVTQKDFSALIRVYKAKADKVPGKTVILYSDDAFCFFVGFFALLAAGKELILPTYYSDKLLQELGCDDIFTDSSHNGSVIINCDNIAADTPAAGELLLSAEGQIYFYTSGSTGVPKKIGKRFQNMLDEAEWLSELLNDALESNAVFLATVNVNHMYGIFYHFLVPFCNSAVIDTTMIFTPEQLTELAGRYESVFLASSPAFLGRISRYKDEYSFPKTVRGIVSAGGVLEQSVANACADMLGVYPLEIFGSTETGGIAWKNTAKSEQWTLYPPVSAHADSGRLFIDSGFIDEPFEMADIVEFSDERHFILKGRGDRLVKFEEKRVSLPELEQIIASAGLTDVVHVAHIAGDKAFLGACITLNKQGKDFLLNNGKLKLVKLLKNKLLETIDPVCVPSKWRFVEEMPLNAQGKIISKKIESIFSHNIAEPLVLEKSIRSDGLDMSLCFLEDSLYFKGHFPGLPLLAGVVQTHFAVYWASMYIQQDMKINRFSRVKFTQMIFPGDVINLNIRKSAKGFEYKYMNGDIVYSSGVIEV